VLRIREVTPLDETRLRLTLTDGSVVERDVRPLLIGPVFDGIRTDRDEFRRVAVEEGTLAWPNGADLCPDAVIWGGLPPADSAASPPAELKTA